MSHPELPSALADFARQATDELRRVYDFNAERHDQMVGDDAIVFGVSIYRNSWFVLERLIEDLDGWKSARPDGSLVICGAGYRIHVYRYGQDEDVDLDSFRLDAGTSETKRSIAVTNGVQLTLDLEPTPGPDTDEPDLDLRELVIVHAGNPDDGCCGVWIGAPIPADEVNLSPWYWIAPIWRIERPLAGDSQADRASRLRHDQLPEPEIAVEAIDGGATQEQAK